MNHPEVSRPRAIEAIKFLNRPMWRTQIVDLRRAQKEFQRNADINALLAAVEDIRSRFGNQHSEQTAAPAKPAITRNDLRLICFDLVSA